MPNARAAVLRHTGAPMTIETLEVGPLAPGNVLVRIRAAGLCHTDLEAIDGALAIQLPAVLGHEAAGEVAEIGPNVSELSVGDRVVLSWNPHCGSCFYCERAQPILCATFLANGPRAFHFDAKATPRNKCVRQPAMTRRTDTPRLSDSLVVGHRLTRRARRTTARLSRRGRPQRSPQRVIDPRPGANRNGGAGHGPAPIVARGGGRGGAVRADRSQPLAAGRSAWMTGTD